MTYTQKQIETFAEMYEDMTDYAEKIVEQYMDASGKQYRHIINASFTEYGIGFTYEPSYCGCCSDPEYGSLPLSYLWESDSLEKMKNETEDKRVAEDKRVESTRLENERKTKASKERHDQDEYKRLQSKYGKGEVK